MAQTTIQGTFLGDGTVTGAKIGADFISAQTALAAPDLVAADELIVSDGGVIKKMAISVLEIAASQITASGTLPALNGAALTALTAANITASGTLPALNGAALTALTAANITASGTLPALNGAALTALNADNIGSGTVPVARLGDGNESNSRFLRGDNTWQEVSGGTTVNGDVDNSILTYINSSGEFTAESELKYNGAGNLYYSRAGTVQFDMVPTGGSSQAWALSARTDGTFRITNDTDGSIDFKIDGDGAITTARQPGFQVYLSSDSGTGQNGDVDIVPFNSTSGGRDQGGYFNTTGSNETIRGITVLPYQFLAPVAGFYLLTCYIAFAGQGSGTDRAAVAFDVVPDGGSMTRYNSRHATSGLTTELRLPFSMVVYVAANAQIRCMAGTYGAANQQGTRKIGSWFSGILLG